MSITSWPMGNGRRHALPYLGDLTDEHAAELLHWAAAMRLRGEEPLVVLDGVWVTPEEFLEAKRGQPLTGRR